MQAHKEENLIKDGLDLGHNSENVIEDYYE